MRATHTVRRAGLVDAGALAEIQLRTSLHAYAHIFPPDAPTPTIDQITERWWHHITADGGRAFAAVDADGAVVGCAAAHLHPTGDALGHLQGLYVDPASWGRGLGRALHDAVVGWLDGRGVDEAVLWVLEENHVARRLYERWGWELVAGARYTHPGLPVTEVCYRRTSSERR